MTKTNNRNGCASGVPYAPPRLRIYGGVLKLTAAGSNGLAENGSNNPNRTRS